MADITVDFEITQEDIALGQRHKSKHCAAALAIRRKLPKAAIGVSMMAAEDDWFITVPLPREVGDFIVRFDSGQPVEPMNFSLTLTQEQYCWLKR